MRRPAYGLLVGVAILMGSVAFIASQTLDEPLRDPDGFLGPGWVRLPAMVLGAFLVDVVPRSVWRARDGLRGAGAKGAGARVVTEARGIVREHWTRDRVVCVVLSLTAFYVTYVSYRNLKNYLPRMYGEMRDPVLHAFDKWLMFGHEPAVVLHDLLGDGVAAHVLAFIYLIYLPIAPVSLVIWVVWSRNLSFGYWYATANCLTWTLGTISYYLLPTMGPNFWYVWLYKDLDTTGVTSLQESLWRGRIDATWNPFSDSVQSVAGFASLHVALTLVIALVAQYTVRHAAIRWTLWVYTALTVVSTLYFGWHYIADDLAGALIAVVSVYLAGIATGQKFDRRLRASHPTTSTASVPVEEDDGRLAGKL